MYLVLQNRSKLCSRGHYIFSFSMLQDHKFILLQSVIQQIYAQTFYSSIDTILTNVHWNHHVKISKKVLQSHNFFNFILSHRCTWLKMTEEIFKHQSNILRTKLTKNLTSCQNMVYAIVLNNLAQSRKYQNKF